MNIINSKPVEVKKVVGIIKINDENTIVTTFERKSKDYVIEKVSLNGAQDGDIVSVEILPYNEIARVKEILGNHNSEKAITEIALLLHKIPHTFSQEVIDAAHIDRPLSMTNREDWRHIPLITIDPESAKDHDDAIFAEPDSDPENIDGHILYVAIADVAHYVRPNTILDDEALLRGNSVYFPDRVVPMLPENISNDLCSLKEHIDRPSIAVRMRIDKEGRKIDHTFHRIMMHSATKLSYQQAQYAIDGNPDEKTSPILDTILRPIWSAYEALKIGRNIRQPLNLDLPERKILLDEQGMVSDVVTPERLDAHRLIEEFMVMANVAAAETLEQKKSHFVYRIHDEPVKDKLDGLRKFFSTFEIKIVKTGIRPANFNTILEKFNDTPHAQIVNDVILRSQSQAEYSPNNIGHFGLNLGKYAHFTSPIRRYSDLIVHRALISALGFGDDGHDDTIKGRLEGIVTNLSMAERRGMLAERDTKDRLIAGYFSDKVGAKFQGRISGVVKAGIFVRLLDTGAEGFIRISTVGNEYFDYDEANFSMIGNKTGQTYQLGDLVKVSIAEAKAIAGSLTFNMESYGKKGKPISKRRRR